MTAQHGVGFHGSGSDCGVSVTTPGGVVVGGVLRPSDAECEPALAPEPVAGVVPKADWATVWLQNGFAGIRASCPSMTSGVVGSTTESRSDTLREWYLKPSEISWLLANAESAWRSATVALRKEFSRKTFGTTEWTRSRRA